MAGYFAYIARCSDNTLYSGYTNDFERREKIHNEGKGALYTRMRRPIKIVYTEKFETRSAAMKREYELKRLTKSEKEKMIK